MLKNEYLKHPSRNVMVDIETLDTIPNSVILYINAIHFNIETQEIHDSINIPISIDSCLKSDMSINADTLLFWINGKEEVKNEVINNSRKFNIKKGLLMFKDFLTNLHDINGENNSNIHLNELNIWSKDPQFDLAIIKNSINKILNQDVFWNIRKERSVRTILAFNESFGKEIKEKYESNHHPYYDSIVQIKTISEILNKINYEKN